MPTEGRDFETEVRFGEHDQPNLQIRGLTPIGRAFAEHCRLNIAAAIQESQEESNGKRSEPKALAKHP